VIMEEKILFKVSRTRLAAGAATIALAAGGIGVGVVSAGASTAACNNATGALAGSCGDLVTASGYGLAVQTPTHGHVSAGARIVSSNHVASSTTTDFYAHQTNGNDNERVLEYAPGAHESGLCVTASRSSLTLQRCSRNSASQEFYGLGDTQNDTGNSNGGLQWLNAATGGVIDISNRGNVSLEGLSRASNDRGTYLHWVQ
jgi:hypothetical protein